MTAETFSVVDPQMLQAKREQSLNCSNALAMPDTGCAGTHYCKDNKIVVATAGFWQLLRTFHHLLHHLFFKADHSIKDIPYAKKPAQQQHDRKKQPTMLQSANRVHSTNWQSLTCESNSGRHSTANTTPPHSSTNIHRIAWNLAWKTIKGLSILGCCTSTAPSTGWH